LPVAPKRRDVRFEEAGRQQQHPYRDELARARCCAAGSTKPGSMNTFGSSARETRSDQASVSSTAVSKSTASTMKAGR
jgi:hypothetical protein